MEAYTPRQHLIDTLAELGLDVSYKQSLHRIHRIASQAGLDRHECYAYLVDRRHYTNPQIACLCDASVIQLAEEEMEAEASEYLNGWQKIRTNRKAVKTATRKDGICKSGWYFLEFVKTRGRVSSEEVMAAHPQYKPATVRAQLARLKRDGHIASERHGRETTYTLA